MAKYSWKPGSQHKVDAEVAGRVLEEIAEAHDGCVMPEHVVEASRPESAPLHDEFEWDDAVAAELYRLDQARHIIRSITVQVEVPGGTVREVRAFVNVKSPVSEDIAHDGAPVRAYIRTVDALQDPALRQQVVERALAELNAWRERWKTLHELAQVFEALELAVQTVLTLDV